MKFLAAGLFATGLLTACGGPTFIGIDNGSGGGGSGGTVGGSTSGIPAALSGDLNTATYNATAGTLSLDITGFASPLNGVDFVRDASLDIVSGDGTTTYQAYRYQTTTDNRAYLAYFASGANAVFAGATGTEFESGSYFGGTTYGRLDVANMPTSGSATFHTGYAGVMSLSPNSSTDRGSRVSGDVFMSVNLTQGTIEGNVTNRAFVDTVDGSGQAVAGALGDLNLIVTNLSGTEFLGSVKIGTTAVGSYGGTLGGVVSNTSAGSAGTGTSPAYVAGVLVFAPYAGPETEWGTFVAPVCGGPSASPTCP